MKTLDYYNKNAKVFYDRTIQSDLSDDYNRFLKHLTPGTHILDAGCGSGRDSLHFLNEGYQVNAFDASEEMVKMSSNTTGLLVQHLNFHDMNFRNEFEGVWASASLLHTPYEETRAIYQKIHNALKQNGIFYASYKYGEDFMPTPDRHFWNMTEKSVLPYLEGLFDVLDIWKKVDNRSQVSPSPEKFWLNFVVRKVA